MGLRVLLQLFTDYSDYSCFSLIMCLTLCRLWSSFSAAIIVSPKTKNVYGPSSHLFTGEWQEVVWNIECFSRATFCLMQDHTKFQRQVQTNFDPKSKCRHFGSNKLYIKRIPLWPNGSLFRSQAPIRDLFKNCQKV